MCAWGKHQPTSPVPEWTRRLKSNDPTFTSLNILPFRKPRTDEWKDLFDALAHNDHLQELYASGHPLPSEALVALGNALPTNRGLRRLCVGHKDLGRTKGFDQLCHGVLAHSALQVWDLDWKGLGGEEGGAQALAKALLESKKTTTRDPSSPSSSSSSSPLEHLILSRNGLTEEDGSQLLEALSALPHLRKLDLGMNDLSTLPSPFLQHWIQGSSTLHSLILSGNPLSQEGARALGSSIRTSTSLCVLEASGSPSEVEDQSPTATYGDALLAGMVEEAVDHKSPCPLERLWLDRVSLGSEGPSHLGIWLSRHATSLQDLRLRACDLGDTGIQSILSSNPSPSLTQVELGLNGLTDPSLHLLLRIGGSIQRLGLFGNALTLTSPPLSPEDLLSSQLKTLDIGGNHIALEGLSSLHTTLLSSSSPLPHLTLIEMGGNRVQGLEEEWSTIIERIISSRPSLDLHWKAQPFSSPPPPPPPLPSV
ncbi:MAG: hypothetical protein DHS80DRAFT_33153 [Piptocephalis tieghemiana]|nr:MAG: hypothetical protein DHS80DRAFT_33153 [Piptocephalis tieghemiana]